MIRIQSRQPGFRRCGVSHPKEETYYADDYFTDEEFDTLSLEPMLTVVVIDDDAIPETVSVHSRTVVGETRDEEVDEKEDAGSEPASTIADNDKSGAPAESGDTSPVKPTKPEDPAALDAALVDAIGGMLKEDPDRKTRGWWLRSGAPEVKEIVRRLGYDITAAERDRVWAPMIAPQG